MFVLLLLLWMAPLQAQTLPPVASARPFPVPTTEAVKLPNGLRVLAISKPEAPVVTLGLLVRAADPEQANRGFGSLTLELLTKGNQDPTLRTERQIAEALDSLGTELTTVDRSDYALLQMTVLPRNQGAALRLLKTLVAGPTFPKEELIKAQVTTGLQFKSALDDGNFTAGVAFRTFVLKGTAYASPDSGLPRQVRGINRGQLLRFYQDNYRATNMTLILSGNADLALAQQIFNDYPLSPSRPRAQYRPSLPQAPPKLVIIDRPDAPQSTIFYSVLLPPQVQLEAASVPGYSFNSVLGEGYSSRLNQELRIKRGLTYGASSRIESRRDRSWFSARTETKPESTLEAVTLMAGLIGDLKNNPPPTTELATRVTASLGARTATLTTTQGILAQVSRLVIYDRPLSTLATFDSQVRAITPAQVQQFAQRYLGEAHIVIVGPAAKFIGPLQARFGPAQRVPYRLFVKSLLGR